MLGLKKDGAVRLSTDIGSELVIAEGIETALSAMQLGYGATWSVLDANGIRKFPVLPGVARLTIAVDHDISGTGQKSAAECRRRWQMYGRRVHTVMASRPGEDINDVLRRRASGHGQ
jgi:putative DNA primase/helicase